MHPIPLLLTLVLAVGLFSLAGAQERGSGEPGVEELLQKLEDVKARLNGVPLERPWFYHRELAQGGRLELALGPEPNTAWGSRDEDAPPSMSTD